MQSSTQTIEESKTFLQFGSIPCAYFLSNQLKIFKYLFIRSDKVFNCLEVNNAAVIGLAVFQKAFFSLIDFSFLQFFKIQLRYACLYCTYCFGSITLTLELIGRDGGLITLCQSCGFARQQRVLKMFPGPGRKIVFHKKKPQKNKKQNKKKTRGIQ